MRNVDNVLFNCFHTRCISVAEAIHTFSSTPNTCDESLTTDAHSNSLFVYPAQCNFSGVKYPLSWVAKAQQGFLDNTKNENSRWFCLLDAATHVSTNPLDLSGTSPDFVCLSFYKMFGLPTGLGALLVRNTSAYVLRKKYYGGGTVQVALSSQSVHVLRPILHERFEDGTINFLSIIAVRHGLDRWKRDGISIATVSDHCFRLARYTYYRLLHLHHANSQHAVHLYSDTTYDDPATQGGIVNFNMIRDDGQYIGFVEVLNLANLHGIHLRTGCFCNPGACQRHLGITDEQYFANFKAGHVCGDDKDLIEGRPTGSIRVSFGPHSRQKDADRLLNMLIECFVTKPVIIQEPVGWSDTSALLRTMFENISVQAEPNNKVNEAHHNVLNSNGQADICYGTTSNLLSSEKLNLKQSNLRLKLMEICLYPIKSCGALKVQRWSLDHLGLKFDRNWMIVSDSGTALTQKHEPRMCMIKPLIDFERNLLKLTYQGYPSCTVPIHSDEKKESTSVVSLCQSKVCGDNVQGEDCGEAVAKWLSSVLGREGLRLMHQSDIRTRTSKKKQENGSTSLSLSNQAQFLLVNENSVKWLSEKLSNSTDCAKETLLDRFRSNLIIQGDCPAFQEQFWKQITIGSINFNVDGPCGRCQMICIDQSTGQKTKEPLTTLAANCKGSMKFGIYLSQTTTGSDMFISVGDPVIPFMD